MSKHLILGYRGQVGAALFEVLTPYKPRGLDLRDGLFFSATKFDVIHCCIPYGDLVYSDTFNKTILQYTKDYLKLGGLLIIHSTVPLGISTSLGAVHSPIRGVHPNLVEGIKTFVKFFGGPRAHEAADYFSALGITCFCTEEAETTEALKLWDTTAYGWNIVLEKAVKAYCDKYELDFDVVYTWATTTYNDGFKRLGNTNVQRPVLRYVEGPIGGHCVIPNARLLGGDLAEFILHKNEEYG